MFQFNQESAQRAGMSGVQTGANIFKVSQCEWREHNGYKSLNFELETKDGAKAFVDLTYQGADGKEWKGNVNHINAIMGLTGINQLSQVPAQGNHGPITIAPEIAGKLVGLVLHKQHYTKGDGTDGSKSILNIAFDAKTKKTFAELAVNKPAKAVDAICKDLKDEDKRKPSQGAVPQNDLDAYQNSPMPDNDGWDDNLDF